MHPNELQPAPNRLWLLETLVIVLLCYLKAGGEPPDVNEAHYLAKARHYWDPAWCPYDFFLNSSDAHAVFYWTFGWVCALVSLPAAAWIGRIVVWLLLAWSWQRLSFALAPMRGAAILSGGLMIVLTTVGHMAGEWIVGGVEGKGFAYALVFLAMEQIVRGRWSSAWLFLGGAASFHVLVGGWGVIAAMLAWLVAGKDRPRVRSMLPGLIGGFVLSLPGLLPVVLLNRGASAQVTATANIIYVFQRLDHHLVFSKFDHVLMARHAVIVLAFGALGWWNWKQSAADESLGRLRRLLAFVGGALVLTVAGIAIDQVTAVLESDRIAAALLRFYWYRLGDVIIPCGVALLSTMQVWRLWLPRAAALVAMIVILSTWCFQQNQISLPSGVLATVPRAMGLDVERARAEHEDWKRVCEWISSQTPEDAVFLTPRQQQTFKWYASRAEVVSVKDVPQDAVGLLEWDERVRNIFPRAVERLGLAAFTDDALLSRADKYGASYVIFEPRKYSRATNLERVYPLGDDQNEAFAVYRIAEP
jgi:hypothetical protein